MIRTPAPHFTARLLEGPPHAPRVVFLDPIPDYAENMLERVAKVIDRDGEAVFAINRYAISEGYRRLGMDYPLLEHPAFGAPDVVRCLRQAVHRVFTATLPLPWLTGLVCSFALSSVCPTIGQGVAAHQWLAALGPDDSNCQLWAS